MILSFRTRSRLLFLVLLLCHFNLFYARSKQQFVISGDHLLLVDPDSHKEYPLAMSKAVVTAHDGLLFVNKKQLRLPLAIIKSASGMLRCNNKQMVGAIIISYLRDGTCSCASYNPATAKQKELACIVKVLLDQKGNDACATWEISSKEQMDITHHHTKRTVNTPKQSIAIMLKKGVLYINNKKCAHVGYLITSTDKHLTMNGVTYHGSLLLTKYKDNYCIINEVPLEEYLSSVLHSESWPGWPLEVNKAFAIASRSYVIAMIMRAKKSERPYHIKNSNVHQTYRGVHDKKVLKDAVKQTRGIFLAHNGEPITAMFDSCCGGIIPAKIEGVDFKKAPYLARSYACNYCKNCSIFSWQATYDINHFAQLLFKIVGIIGRIKTCKISKKDPAGLIQEVELHTTKGTYTISVKQLYAALKEMKSFCFTLACKGGKIILKGKGYGHHIGLCQWGAREMVRQGWDYIAILQFYYPGTTFMQLR